MSLRIKTALFVSSLALVTSLPAAAQMEHHGDHKMPGHSMSEMAHDRTAHMVEALATVTAVLPEENHITLSHAAIPEVSWPAATMKFPVSGGIDVTAFSPGDRVQFTLHRAENGSLPLVELCPASGGEVKAGLCAKSAMMAGHDMGGMKEGAAHSSMMKDDSMGHHQMGHGEMQAGSMDHSKMGHGSMDHGAMDHSQMGHQGMDDSEMGHEKITVSSVTTTGTLLQIDEATRELRIKHDPIPAIGWPVMTMQFKAATDVNLTGLSKGDAISFDFNPETDDGYVISAIRPANLTQEISDPATSTHSDHDGH